MEIRIVRDRELFVCDTNLRVKDCLKMLQGIWTEFRESRMTYNIFPVDVTDILLIRQGLNDYEKSVLASREVGYKWGYEETVEEETIIIEGETESIPHDFLGRIEYTFNAEKWHLG